MTIHGHNRKETVPDQHVRNPRFPSLGVRVYNNCNLFVKLIVIIVHYRNGIRLHSTTETTSEQPLFVEDTNLNGYLSDISNSILRRGASPKVSKKVYSYTIPPCIKILRQ